jgi:methyl-accepting chemotaxis protein
MEAFAKFRGNIREMHQPSAVGKMVSFKEEKYFDPESKKFYKGVFVSAYISKGAQDAWEKVLDGTYTGFSIGGRMNKWDDAYDEKSDKAIRVIKEYDLIELSLVDSPANQFANIMSVEKVDGVDTITGSSADTIVENVFWDSESGLVTISENETELSPISGEEMKNIGFVEKNDSEKTTMIKFLVDSAKGIRTIKIAKEDNPMTENTEVVAEAAPEVNEVEVAPEAPAEAVAKSLEVTEDTVTEKSDAVVEEGSAPSIEEVTEKADEAIVEVASATAEVAKAVSEIQNSVTNALSDLAATVKAMQANVDAITKSLESVTEEVKDVKGSFNEFGKTVDAVVADTAFRKSGDLGEIVQESPSVIQKSLWGGRFLTNSDLFN